MKQTQSGFTLVELLVVIAIIGLLATITVLAMSGSQQKARDTKRIADLDTIQSTIEVCFVDACAGASRYPNDTTWTDLGTTLAEYTTVFPQDPTNDGDNYFIYATNASRREYVLATLLEDTAHSALDTDIDQDYGDTVGWADDAGSEIWVDSVGGVNDGTFGRSATAGGPGAPDQVLCSSTGVYCLGN